MISMARRQLLRTYSKTHRPATRCFGIQKKMEISKTPPEETRVFIVDENQLATPTDALVESMTPKVIVAQLDRFIIGQTDAKRAVAISLRNRWRRQKLEDKIKAEVSPMNILLIGPTGSGKTEISRRLAKLVDAPLVKVEATKYTEVGIVGASAEDCINDLVDRAVQMEREKRAKELKATIDDTVEAILLSRIPGAASQKDDYLKKLRRGEFENVVIDISTLQKPKIPGRGKAGDTAGMMSSFAASMQGAKEKKMRVSVSDAREILKAAELEKHLDETEVAKKAIKRAEEGGIIVLDEIDKICRGSSDMMGYSSGKGENVQKELLTLVEGTIIQTNHGPCNTEHILFIGSGSFHNATPSDLLPELQGRLPIRVELKPLDKDDFVKILTETETNQIIQQQALFKTEGLNIEFSEDAIDEVASLSYELNHSIENIGARRLRSVISKVLEELSFDAPDKEPGVFTVDRAFVKERCEGIVKNIDLSKYVL